MKTKLMIKAGKYDTFFMRKLKELEERVNSDQVRGEIHGKTLKGMSFQFQRNRY